MAGKEGFWRVDYVNEAGGGGWGIIVFDTGVIVGTDAWGGVWDGVYEFNPRTNLIEMMLTVAFPPQGTSSVSGRAVPQGHTETYSLCLPNDLGREVPFTLTIQGRPMAARFKKIRNFPH
jgi:hypothetical protein